ncbi:S8 family serine peptidase [Ruminococcus sp. XPD3002]|uniref:S8 family serine peptidase n=1 Tax=Ruminococcus sp. XPD3002 TaxID=1452269 RepID=UPI00091913AF|nr:hypothetical protein SAMN04487832_11949 [Ruminococcus flavefaciens]
MSDIRIAVLDTGIDKILYDELLQQNRILGCKGFRYDYYYKTVFCDDRVEDLNGHGTQSVALIDRICPHTKFNIVKLLGVSGLTNESVLEKALEYASKLDVDIIVSSSSLKSSLKSEKLEEICNKIHSDGKLLIFSLRNGDQTSIPAEFESVIGVIGGNIPNDELRWNEGQKIQLQCSSETAVVKALYGRRSVYNGNSKATSLAAGLIAKLMYENNIYGSDVTAYLNRNCYADKLENKPFGREIDSINKTVFDHEKEEYLVENSIGYHQVLYSLCEFFKINSPERMRTAYLMEENNSYLWHNIEEFLRYMEYIFQKPIDVDNLRNLEYSYLFFENVINKNESDD